jgi:hypothetical protein
MVKHLLGLVTGLLTLIAVAGAAHADGPLLVLPADGDAMKPAERQALDAAIAARLDAYKDLKRVAAPSGDITDIMIDLECIDLDDDCLGRIGANAKAARVLYIAVEKKGTQLGGSLRWVDVATKATTARDEVTAKTAKALTDALVGALDKQLGPLPVADKPAEPTVKPEAEVKPEPTTKPEQPVKPAAPPGVLIVETNRIQAQIFIDQEYAGTGTATIERPPGRYTLRLTHPGDETQFVQVDIESGKTATRQFTLKPSAQAGGPGDPSKPAPKVDDSDDSWVLWVIVGAVVVAGAATAIGIAASGDDARPSGTLLLGLDPSGAWRDPITRGGRR